MTNKPLTDREKAFCRFYVMHHEAKRAAVLAGYSAKSAHVTGHRLLQKSHIRKEIDRLEAIATKEAATVSGLLSDANKVADTPEDPAARRLRGDMDADTVAAATRAYVLAGLIENFEIALGRRKRTIVKFKKIPAKGKVAAHEESVEVQIFDPNHNAANQAGLILLKELGGQQEDPNKPVNPEMHPALEEAMRTFRQSRPEDPA